MIERGQESLDVMEEDYGQKKSLLRTRDFWERLKAI